MRSLHTIDDHGIDRDELAARSFTTGTAAGHVEAEAWECSRLLAILDTPEARRCPLAAMHHSLTGQSADVALCELRAMPAEPAGNADNHETLVRKVRQRKARAEMGIHQTEAAYNERH